MSQPRTTPRWHAHIPHGRLLGIDVLRAVAILGMAWTHFALPRWVSAGGGPETPEVLDWVNRLVHVRSLEIFFLLAGVTVALATGTAAPHRGRTLARSSLRVLVRAVLLLSPCCLMSIPPGRSGREVPHQRRNSGPWKRSPNHYTKAARRPRNNNDRKGK